MSSVILIGGGIIGLCSAYYLQQEGHTVTVIDQSDMQDGCSYGNAGYLSPSHFIPLATPGIVKQGFKWMLNAKSPFYVQPRLNANLINWGLKFIKSATHEHGKRSAIPLRDISLLSKKLYEDLSVAPGYNFYYEQKGMIEFFQTHTNANHAVEMVNQSNELGLEAVLLNKEEVQQLEPDLKIDVLGGIHFKCDAHLYPNKLMSDLKKDLQNKGVIFVLNEVVKEFIIEKNVVKGARSTDKEFFADELVLATGALTGDLAKKLNLKIPMIGGRGYSVTFDNPPFKVHHPIILTEARVAITPMAGSKVRFGGTMEITSFKSPPKLKRVEGIFESVKKYFPDFDLEVPRDKIWYGYRPCSADGLPYIGRSGKYSNLVIASGHAMLGLSLGAATGKLVSEIIGGKQPSVDLVAFNPDRFA